MTTTHSDGSFSQKPLRLWPAVVLAILILAAKYVLPLVWPEGAFFGVMGMALFAIFVMLWWAFFSRAPRIERWGGFLLMIAALWITYQLVHISIAKGAMGFLFPIISLPVLGFVFALWAIIFGRASTGLRRATMVITILLAS